MATARSGPGAAKIGPVSEIGVLLGFTDTAYTFLHIATGTIRTSCDVRFFDDISYGDYLNVDGFKETLEKIAGPSQSPADDDVIQHTKRITTEHDYADVQAADAPFAFVSYLKSKFRSSPTSLSEAVPGSYKSALNSPFVDQWIAAIDDELEAHRDNNTWTMIPRPKNICTIPAIWKFTVKYPDGKEKAKARLVAFGCADRNIYTIDETYAPVCRVEAVRLALAIAVRKRFTITTIDVTTALLYGDVKDTIYLSIPDGLDIDRNKFVFRLNKALYGLRTSSRTWTNLLHQHLLRIGYVETPEKCVYKHHQNRKLTLLLTYVDDILIVGNNDDFVAETIRELHHRFRIRVDRTPTNFIGLDFKWHHGNLEINQTYFEL